MTLLESLILELGAEVPLTIHIMVLLSSFCQWSSMYVCRRCGGCHRCIDVPSPLPMVRPQAAAFIMETKKAQRKCWTFDVIPQAALGYCRLFAHCCVPATMDLLQYRKRYKGTVDSEAQEAWYSWALNPVFKNLRHFGPKSCLAKNFLFWKSIQENPRCV